MGGTDAPKPMTQEQSRERVEAGAQKGETVRERTEEQLQGEAKGPGGGKMDKE